MATGGGHATNWTATINSATVPLMTLPPLRVTEELLLLILDAESGDIQYSFPSHQRDALVGSAALMDLALENRIDTDAERLFPINPEPVGDDLLDPTLLDIVNEKETHDTAWWIRRTAGQGGTIRDKALNRLIERGILEREANGLVFLSRSVARARRYPTVDGESRKDVHSRVMETLFSEDIPDPHDIMIIGLAAACDVFESILSRDELAEVRERIDTISRLDLMGRTIRESIRRIEPPAPAKKTVRPYEEIPEVPGLPIAGSALQMAKNVQVFLEKCYRKYGPIFRVRAFGYQLLALVGPEANVFCGRVSGTHLRSHEPYSAFAVAVGAHRVMLNMDGPEHLRMRKLQVNGYSPKKFEEKLDLAHDVVLRMIDTWPVGRPIGVQYAMQQIIAEQIGMSCTSVSSHQYIDDIICYLEVLASIHITRQWPNQMRFLPRFRRAEQRLEDFCNEILEAHRPERRGDLPPDFVDDLLEMNRNDPQLLPETDLRANLLAPYLVGIDTSASVCTFMLYALLKHPALLQQMREEVDAMYEQGPLTADGLRKLDVTHRIAMETLRMYPVAPALLRTVSNSFEFGGYRVPAGIQAIIGTTVSHYLPEYFPDPHRFDIERHSRAAKQQRPSGALAPFGVGRHRCIGSGLSEVQITLTMATIVRETELMLERPERPLKIKQRPAPHADKSLQFRLVRRRGENRAAA